MNLPATTRSMIFNKQTGASTLLALLLAACGGGGGSDGGVIPGVEPTVSSASTAAAMYGSSLLITITGTDLDNGLSVASPGCSDMARSTTPPTASTATTAYYTCMPSALGANQVNVTRTSDGASLATAAFSVPVPQVTMTVSNGAGVDGEIVFTLAPDKTPLTVNNFLAYVHSGFYDGTVFHRIAVGFVMQGGGYLPITPGVVPTLQAPLRAPIALEVGRGLSNLQWTIAMARTAELDSATSQFFINVVDNVPLDTQGGGYAVFGSLGVSSVATANAMLAAPCAPLASIGSECAPNPNIVIVKAEQTR